MGLTLPSSNPSRIRSSLHRLGAEMTPVYEIVVDDTVDDDPLNNDPSGSESLSKKGKVFATLFYPSTNDEQQGDTGEFDGDYPQIVVPDDERVATTVVDDDRMLIDGLLYEMDTSTKRPGFVVWKTSIVDPNVSDEYDDLP